MKAEMVAIGKKLGDPTNPVESIYVKILPRGTSNIPGVLIGFPVLDVPPFGLGWSARTKSHFFTKLEAHLPRAELQRRVTFCQEKERWVKDGYLSGPNDTAAQDACYALSEAARQATDYCHALYEGPSLVLGPLEQAIVPVVWSSPPLVEKEPGLVVRTLVDSANADSTVGAESECKGQECLSSLEELGDSFYCMNVPAPLADGDLTVVPGICARGEKEGMVIVANETPASVPLESGQLLAQGMVIPAGSAMVRRGCPESEAVCWTLDDASIGAELLDSGGADSTATAERYATPGLSLIHI